LVDRVITNLLIHTCHTLAESKHCWKLWTYRGRIEKIKEISSNEYV